MLRINIKTYNYFLLEEFIKQLNKEFSLQFTLLPSKCKSFVVKKSPHVFGRSKEKYYLRTYSGIIIIKNLRKKDQLNFFLLFNSYIFIEGLGIKFTFI
jgi:ribosomal protein S10